MSELNDRLRDWDLSVQRLAEQADARLAEANQLVRDLHAAGQVKPWVLIGPVMSVQPYDPGFGPDETGQVTQALLVIPDGLGVMFVDTEEYN